MPPLKKFNKYKLKFKSEPWIILYGCQAIFSNPYLKPHNTIKRKPLVRGFQNGLIYLSSINGSQDMCI